MAQAQQIRGSGRNSSSILSSTTLSLILKLYNKFRHVANINYYLKILVTVTIILGVARGDNDAPRDDTQDRPVRVSIREQSNNNNRPSSNNTSTRVSAARPVQRGYNINYYTNRDSSFSFKYSFLKLFASLILLSLVMILIKSLVLYYLKYYCYWITVIGLLFENFYFCSAETNGMKTRFCTSISHSQLWSLA